MEGRDLALSEELGFKVPTSVAGKRKTARGCCHGLVVGISAKNIYDVFFFEYTHSMIWYNKRCDICIYICIWMYFHIM